MARTASVRTPGSGGTVGARTRRDIIVGAARRRETGLLMLRGSGIQHGIGPAQRRRLPNHVVAVHSIVLLLLLLMLLLYSRIARGMLVGGRIIWNTTPHSGILLVSIMLGNGRQQVALFATHARWARGP